MKLTHILATAATAIIAMTAISGSASAQARGRFDEIFYLRNNPDVAYAVRRGEYASGYDHFMQHGRYEGRAYRLVGYNDGRWNRNDNFSNRYSGDIRAEINQIYREVLGRDADWQGLNTYQDRYNQGWSLDRIRNDIARSQEARYQGRWR